MYFYTVRKLTFEQYFHIFVKYVSGSDVEHLFLFFVFVFCFFVFCSTFFSPVDDLVTFRKDVYCTVYLFW